MSAGAFLLQALLAGNVLLRFFTNEINVLPRFLNLWDVLVTGALAALAVVSGRRSTVAADTQMILRRLFAFNVVCILGSLLNARHIHFMAMVSQMIMWNEPIVLFLALMHLPFSRYDLKRFGRLFLVLVSVEIAIGVLQVPTFLRTGASEEITGTFRGNAEQYQFFIVLGLLWMLAQREVQQGGKKLRALWILGVLSVIVLIDNKASWIALALTLIMLLPQLPQLRGNVAGKWAKYAVLSVLLAAGYWIVRSSSSTAANKFGNLAEAVRSGNVLNIGKVKAVRDVLRAYVMYPHMVLFGSGAGTFYGRASFQFFPFHISENIENVPVGGYRLAEQEGIADDSASMAGVIEVASGVEAFYRQFFDYQRIYAVGSGTADFPTSSYVCLLGESGLMGTMLYVSFYVMALRKGKMGVKSAAHDAEFFPFGFTAYGGMTYLMLMGAYNFWLDCGRVNTIVWAMLATCMQYGGLERPGKGLGPVAAGVGGASNGIPG